MVVVEVEVICWWRLRGGVGRWVGLGEWGGGSLVVAEVVTGGQSADSTSEPTFKDRRTTDVTRSDKALER